MTTQLSVRVRVAPLVISLASDIRSAFSDSNQSISNQYKNITSITPHVNKKTVNSKQINTYADDEFAIAMLMMAA